MLSLRVVTLLSLWFCLASLMPGKQYLIETDDEPVKRRPYDENKTFWPDSQNKAWGGPWPSNKSKKLGNKSQKVNVNQRGGYGADQEVNVNQVQPKSYDENKSKSGLTVRTKHGVDPGQATNRKNWETNLKR